MWLNKDQEYTQMVQEKEGKPISNYCLILKVYGLQS